MDPSPTRASHAGPGRVTIRAATAADAPRVWALLREFSEFVRLSHLVTGDAERLAAHLTGKAWPAVEGLIAEDGDEAIAYALFFGTFSSFGTEPMVWLEDLYIRESHRGTGLGRLMMQAVARIAVERGSPRLMWAVLDWNEAAIEFYFRLGAARQSAWHVYELEGEPLRSLVADGDDGSHPATSRIT